MVSGSLPMGWRVYQSLHSSHALPNVPLLGTLIMTVCPTTHARLRMCLSIGYKQRISLADSRLIVHNLANLAYAFRIAIHTANTAGLPALAPAFGGIEMAGTASDAPVCTHMYESRMRGDLQAAVVALALPVGDGGAVLVPLATLCRDEVLEDVLAQRLAHELARLKALDGLAQRVRKTCDAA